MPVDDDRVRDAVERVLTDVPLAFEDQLSPPDPGAAPDVRIDLHDALDLEEGQMYASSDAVVVVPWVYSCAHTGYFLGVPPTRMPLELRGATFVDVRNAERDEWMYHRYVDFLGALNQIGVSVSVRPALTEEQLEQRVPPRV
jgi:hypothetical protein